MLNTKSTSMQQALDLQTFTARAWWARIFSSACVTIYVKTCDARWVLSTRAEHGVHLNRPIFIILIISPGCHCCHGSSCLTRGSLLGRHRSAAQACQKQERFALFKTKAPSRQNNACFKNVTGLCFRPWGKPWSKSKWKGNTTCV